MKAASNMKHSCLFIIFVVVLGLSAVVVVVVEGKGNYVEKACRVTTYREVCVESLAAYSEVAKSSPSKWARAGVSVTIREVKALSRYLRRVRRSGRVWGRTRFAISDCQEVVQDALDYLHQSLAVLRTLNAREFQGQVNDVLTWLSTTLTDEDTCMEGLQEVLGRRRGGRSLRVLHKKLTKASYVTSNALALANNLATSRPLS